MKKKYYLYFPLATINEPLTYQLVKEYNVKVNILKAKISPESGGELLVELEATQKNLSAALLYLAELQVRVEPAEKKIVLDKAKCINCGSCTGVCFTDALYLDRDSWELQYNAEKCVACGMCIKACPLRLFNFNEL